MSYLNILIAYLLRKFGEQLEHNRVGCTTGNPEDFPPLDQDSFASTWKVKMEFDFEACNIPTEYKAHIGITYLPPGSVRDFVLDKAKKEIKKAGWIWDKYCAAVEEAIALVNSAQAAPPTADGNEEVALADSDEGDEVSASTSDAGDEIVPSASDISHEVPPPTSGGGPNIPYSKIATGIALGITLGPTLIVGGLGLAGFGTAGVGAGTAAAAIQSIAYRGATQGLFSACQSIAATGAVGAAGTAISGVVGGAGSWLSSRRR